MQPLVLHYRADPILLRSSVPPCPASQEYFVNCPFCRIFLFAVIMKSILLITRVSQHSLFLMKVLHQFDHKTLIYLPSLPSHCRSIYTILTKIFICDDNHKQFWFAARMFSKAMSESTLQKCRDLTFDIKFSVPL